MRTFDKINKDEYDYFTENGELVIHEGKALRDIEKDEVLVSYGKILNGEFV